MADVLTCPHCETALTLPTTAPARLVICACCRGTFPHRADGSATPVLAISPEAVARRRFEQEQLGWLWLLGGIGVLAVWAALYIQLLSELLTFWGGLAVVALLGGVHWRGVTLADQDPGTRGRFVGWTIVLVFAFLGGLAVVAGMVMILLALLSLWRWF